MKSARSIAGSEEARAATHDTGCLGASDLLERALSRPNLQAALKRVRQNKGSPGVDGMTVEALPDYLREHWPALREQLLAGCYQPQAVKRQLIPKSDGGMRELGIPSVLDRFIQQALLQILQPRIDPSFSRHSYGFRPGRRAHQAILAAQAYIQAGRRWVVDVDLEKFFDQPSRCPPQLPSYVSKLRCVRFPALRLRNACSVAGLSGKRYSFVRGSREMTMVPLWMRS